VLRCTEDAECPAGTTCDVGRGSCPPDIPGCCRTVYFASGTPDVLVKGFEAAEFDLRAEAHPQTRFSWSAPPAAERVICGLFVNDPKVEGGRRGRIQNQNKALFRTHVFRIPAAADQEPSVTFDVSDLSTIGEASPCSALIPFKAHDSSYPVVTTLQVGCWAYDTQEVVAATRLRTVKLSDIPEVQAPILDCATIAGSQSDGRFCLTVPQTGVCRRSQCVALDPIDATAPLDGGTPSDGGPVTVNPIRECTDASDSVLCQRSSTFRFGRCVGNRCADQHIQRLEQPLVVSNCAMQGEATNWLNCFDTRVQGYGTCFNSRCRLRCTNNDECTKLVSVLTAEDQVEMSCVKLASTESVVCSDRAEGSYLGLCIPVTEPPCASPARESNGASCN
jgi:hypothetical protein